MPNNADALRAAMDAEGLTDNATRAGIAAIASGESGLVPKSETGYANTNNSRIRMIFGSRVPADDTALTALKADPIAFFNQVYGGRFGNRPGTNDGYDYRGRGYLQHTFRDGYQALADELSRPDIVATPDIVNQPDVAALCAIAYIQNRWDGDSFESMMRAVGNNSPDIQAAKEGYYRAYLSSGEFNYQAPSA